MTKALPWRENNRFSLLCDGADFFPEMLQAIRHARTMVCVEQYLVESGQVLDRFIDELSSAVQRGVVVFVVLDDFGSLSMRERDHQRLQHAGVHLAYFNPLKYKKWRNNLYRDHRKILLIDNRIAFVGGAGIADQFDTASNPLAWRDTLVKVEGEVVEDWLHSFTTVWRDWGRETISQYSRLLDEPLPLGDQSGRVVLGRPGDVRQIKQSFLHRVHAAEQRVWMATAYFIPSRKMRRVLRRAAEKGVDVRLLLPGEETDHPAIRHAGRRFYEKLIRSGVKIYEYQGRFSHSKVQLADDWVSIGSSNVDRWNLRWNLEANQEINCTSFAAEVAAMFIGDFSRSDISTLDEWKNRSRWQKLREWFWGNVALFLDRYSYRKRLRSNGEKW